MVGRALPQVLIFRLLVFIVIVPLPKLDLGYYILPPSQRIDSNVDINRLLGSSGGRNLTFVKAITLIATVPPHDEKLVHTLFTIVGWF